MQQLICNDEDYPGLTYDRLYLKVKERYDASGYWTTVVNDDDIKRAYPSGCFWVVPTLEELEDN